MEQETITEADLIYGGDELELLFWDEKSWLEIDFFKPTPQEFAADLLDELQRRSFDVGVEDDTLTLLIQSASGITDVDEDGDERIGAVVRGRVIDVRPAPEQELQAGIGSVVKVVATLSTVALVLFSIRPVLVEIRRTVRGYTDDEQAVQDFGSAPAISTVAMTAILVGGVVAVLYFTQRNGR